MKDLSMLDIKELRPSHKTSPQDDDRDWVAHSVARRFSLEIHIAKLVVGLAGPDGGEDRAPASGGRTK